MDGREIHSQVDRRMIVNEVCTMAWQSFQNVYTLDHISVWQESAAAIADTYYYHLYISYSNSS